MKVLEKKNGCHFNSIRFLTPWAHLSFPRSRRPQLAAQAPSWPRAELLHRHRHGRTELAPPRGSRRSRGCASPAEQGTRRARPTRGCAAPAEEGGGRRPAGLRRAAPWRYGAGRSRKCGGGREGKAAEMVVGGGDGERSWGGDGKTRRADGTRAGRLRPSDFVEGNEPAS